MIDYVKVGNGEIMNKYYEIFRRNFPFIVRNENEVYCYVLMKHIETGGSVQSY